MLTSQKELDQDDIVIDSQYRDFLVKTLGTTKEDSSTATKLIGEIRHIKKHF